jgi:hypothetical protein
MRSFPKLLLALLVFALAAAPAGAAQKKPSKPRTQTQTVKPVTGALKASIGIADQKSTFFTDPRFRGLGLKIARRSVAWDTMQYDWQIADVDAWLQGARAAGVTPLITFARSRIDAKRHAVPSAAAVRAEFVKFRQRWPWVTEFVASNESNHFGEPTGRRPQLAAQYYKAMRSACPTCKIAGATLLDQPNLVSWSRAFIRAAKETPKYWALHNYVSANRFDDTRTVDFLKGVRGEVWVTEVGGLVDRRTPDRPGKAKLKEGITHAAQVTSYIFNELARVSPRIKRIYVYHWDAGGPTATWDSGLISATGAPRPAFTALERFLKGSRTGRGVKKYGAPKPKPKAKGKSKRK